MTASYRAQILLRRSTVVLAGNITGAVIAVSLGLSTLSVISICICFGVLSYLTHSVLISTASVFVGFALLCVGINLFSSLRHFPTISGVNLLILLFVLSLLAATLLRVTARSVFSASESVSALIVALVGFALYSELPGTSSAAFQTLSSVGEDNAAWLQALADSSTRKGAVLTAGSLFGGGTGTGVSLTIFRQAFSTFSPDFGPGIATNPLILVRGSFLVAILAAIVVAAGVTRALPALPLLGRVVCGTTSGLLSYSLITGMTATGHFSAVIATGLLSSSVFLLLCFDEAEFSTRLMKSGITVVTSIGAGLCWFPLMPLALLVAASTTVLSFVRMVRATVTLKSRIFALIAVGAIGSIMWIVIDRLFASVIDNLSWRYFSEKMSLNGGVQGVSGFLSLIGVSAVVFVASAQSDQRQFRDKAQYGAFALPLMLSSYCVVVYLISFVASPYSPRYGAIKLMYITTCIAVPFTPLAAGKLMGRFKVSAVAQLSVAPLALLTLALIDPGRIFFSWPKNIELRAPWAPTVLTEIERRPQRIVMCLNTSPDIGQDMDAYVCSRMAGGLQGVTTTDEYSERYDYNVWTAANIYGVPPEQGAAAWDETFYRTLTILVSDPMRRDNGDARQVAWLADVDWTAVRIIGPEGQVVKKAGVPLPPPQPSSS